MHAIIIREKRDHEFGRKVRKFTWEDLEEGKGKKTCQKNIIISKIK